MVHQLMCQTRIQDLRFGTVSCSSSDPAGSIILIRGRVEPALGADSPVRVFILSCMSEPLKRIYKASQEKKENTSPRVPKGVLFFYLTAPERVFQ